MEYLLLDRGKGDLVAGPTRLIVNTQHIST